MNRQELIVLIRDKREFRNLSTKFIEQILEFYIASKIIEKLDKKDIIKIVKDTRAKLREVYGAFLSKGFLKRFRFLKSLKDLKDFDNHEKILKLHVSSRERIPYYSEIYEKIFKITGKPKSILDLGCGLNPLSLPFMKIKPRYIALELVEEDAEFIQLYFNKMKIKGNAYSVDLINIDKKLPEADICFMFKLIDTLETLKWDITENLLENLKVKWIVASFATKSLGGRKSIKKRDWFEKMIKDRKYETFSVANELFYVIKQKH
ncbi:MAG: hypothetical protein KKA65_00035 [Nanoarchaeota archaeon]|nr:hypothetical protein [Nanoarchaeota archaeon]MBU4241649.1 hypothetical protein [Nanoarchaeota archaeon]MBU4352361.1 hypothetical protein [Nanoarchaeota archaeon]MBU4455874.1 hypothetical protein [Nanoarchaeota archaeon]MCG2719495.1 hypothetical protein [Nanoarchaeota archaeon]